MANIQEKIDQLQIKISAYQKQIQEQKNNKLKNNIIALLKYIGKTKPLVVNRSFSSVESRTDLKLPENLFIKGSYSGVIDDIALHISTERNSRWDRAREINIPTNLSNVYISFKNTGEEANSVTQEFLDRLKIFFKKYKLTVDTRQLIIERNKMILNLRHTENMVAWLDTI